MSAVKRLSHPECARFIAWTLAADSSCTVLWRYNTTKSFENIRLIELQPFILTRDERVNAIIIVEDIEVKIRQRLAKAKEADSKAYNIVVAFCGDMSVTSIGTDSGKGVRYATIAATAIPPGGITWKQLPLEKQEYFIQSMKQPFVADV